jgi:N-methylhydantoinase B
VTLAVLKGRLEQVADEMDATLYRSAFNPIIAEAHDACHGIYDGESGDTLVQGKSGLPVFVGAMAFAVRAAVKAAATRGGMQNGDIWLFNDPYEGGTHANDFKLVRPFFRDGRLFCFLASVIILFSYDCGLSHRLFVFVENNVSRATGFICSNIVMSIFMLSDTYLDNF